MIAKRFYVSGRVQGVFFRASTQRVARSLNITGFARNLADRRVEVLAIGAADDVAKLARWLMSGPPLASVSHVESQEAGVVTLADFTTE
jgi:acylphosphatase